MKGAEKRRNEILEKDVANTGKRVFLVEGESDVQAYREFFTKKSGTDFEQKWVITHAGGKELVIGILEKEPSWIGLIDRDEWMPETIREKKRELDNLEVLPRFCLESYLIYPDELWDALPKPQQDKIDGGRKQLEHDILAEKNKWLRHGVLWSVVNPLVDGLYARGFQQALLDVDTAQDDDKILEKLKEWHDFLDPDKRNEAFHKRLKEAEKESEFVQITLRIHGKMFFESQVCQVLNRLIKQKKVSVWKDKLFRKLKPPDDLKTIWQKLAHRRAK